MHKATVAAATGSTASWFAETNPRLVSPGNANRHIAITGRDNIVYTLMHSFDLMGVMGKSSYVFRVTVFCSAKK
jgi:hypothetical protein